MNTLKDFVEYKLTHSDKTAEAESYPLIMQNCKKHKKMKQLEICGNTVQDGTPTPDAPVDVVSVGEKSVNLFDVNTYPLVAGQWLNGVSGNLSDTGYTLNACTKDYIPCTELRGKTLTLNHSFGSNPGICFYDEEKVFLSGLKYNSKTVFTFTVPENAVYYRFSTASEFVDEIQIQEGSTATPYEPYGKYKIPVVQRGINLFDKDNVVRLYSSVTVQTNPTETGISCTCGTNNGFFFFLIDLGLASDFEGETISAIMNCPSVATEKFGATSFVICESNGSNRVQISNATVSGDEVFTSATISTGYTTQRLCLRLYVNNISDDVNTFYFNNIMVYEGTDKQAYEPYIEPITTNIFLSEPLRKLGNYADYIDFRENKVVRNISEKFFDGSESWKYEVISSGNNFYTNVSDAYGDRYLPVLCNMGKYYYSGNLTELYSCRISESSNNFNFRYGDYDNLIDFKNKLLEMYNANNPLTITYILKEPKEEPLNLELPKLKAKTSIIEVDTSLTPSSAYGKYIKK